MIQSSESASSTPDHPAVSGHAIRGGYEFGASENEVIAGLSGAMRFVGFAFLVLALLAVLGGGAMVVSGAVEAGAVVVLLAVVYGGMGVRLSRAAASMRAVVDTQGNDIQNFMDAVGQLRRFYSTAAIMSVLGIAGKALGFFSGSH